MAGERKLPAVGKVISGTHGYFWWNNSICYEITSFEAKIKTNRETINFSGQMWDDSNRKVLSGMRICEACRQRRLDLLLRNCK